MFVTQHLIQVTYYFKSESIFAGFNIDNLYIYSYSFRQWMIVHIDILEMKSAASH